MGGRAHLGPANSLAAGGSIACARRARFHHPSRTAARVRGSAGGSRNPRVVSRRPGGISGTSRENGRGGCPGQRPAPEGRRPPRAPCLRRRGTKGVSPGAAPWRPGSDGVAQERPPPPAEGGGGGVL